MSRFFMLASGRSRPLSFDGDRSKAPLLASAQGPWRGVPFELHQAQPIEGRRAGGPPVGEQTLLLVVDGRMDVVYSERGRDVHYDSAPGSLSLHTADDTVPLKRVTGSGQLLAVRLSGWRDRLLPNGFPSSLTFQPPMAPDATLRTLAENMLIEVRRGAPTGALFAESLSLAFLSYAIDKLPVSSMEVTGGLSDEQQRRLSRYIDERLQEDVSVDELAALCGLRARHFSTLFRRAFGCTPYRYVINQRVARGAEQLRRRRCDLGELSARLGFCSSSHFATEFRRVHGTSPSVFARECGSDAGS